MHGTNVKIILQHVHFICRDSSVGIATCYGLDGSGIESRWGKIFHARPYRPWGPPSLLYDGYRVTFPGVKRPGRGVDNPPPSSTKVKERVELYIYSLPGPSWHVLGWTAPLPLCSFHDCISHCYSNQSKWLHNDHNATDTHDISFSIQTL
jgi:hypothetical protein